MDAIYDQAIKSFIETNPKSQARYHRALRYLPGGNTRSVLQYEPFPLAFRSGQGCYLTSLDGDEYLDVVSEFSAAFFGHSHPDIMKAVDKAFQRGINLGGPNEDEVELAEQLVKRFKSIDKVRFTNSGTEANTMALQVACWFTGRKKVLVFSNGYHGGFLSFGATKNVLNLPYDFVIGIYNETEQNEALMTVEIAAIIVEPMQGAGGMIPADKAFLDFLRKAATRIGAVLVFDEIITSRLHIGGLQEVNGVYPDMTTLGKYVGGGFGFGAFGGRSDIMAAFEQSIHHSGTYNNNTLSMAAGVAASKVLTAEKIEAANALGNKLRDSINEIVAEAGQSELITATGYGSTVGMHFHGPSAERLKDTFFFYLLRNRVYCGKRGFISLNLMHKDEHIDFVLGVVKDFMRQIAAKQDILGLE